MKQGIEMEDEYFGIQSPSALFQKLDCFVTLGDFGLDEDENYPVNIQVEQPEIKSFTLSRFFAEEPQVNQFQQKHVGVNHEPKMMRPPRKMSQCLPSFMEELNNNIYQLIEKQVSFQEQQKYTDALNNIDNFTFLEQSLKQPQVFKQFHPQYMRTLSKLKQYRQQKRLEVKQLMAFVCSIGIEFIQEVFNLISKAENHWCFELLKSEGLPTQQQYIEQELQQEQKKNNNKIQLLNSQQVKQQIQTIPSNMNGNNFNDSVLSIVNDALEKKSRKSWTNKDLAVLQQFINNIQNTCITNQQIQELSTQLGRTWYSVQSKLQKMKKNNQDLLSDVKSQSMKQEQNKDLKNTKSSSKYEYTIEEMIKNALLSLDGKCGTKQQIIDQINQIFFNGTLTEDSACLRSITITLSNKQNQFIKKIKGSYKLNDNYQDKPEDDNKMKNKLVWILQNLPDQRGTLLQILEAYTKNMNLDETSQKKIQKQISQALRQSNRFDKRQAKTLYQIQE